MLEVFAITRLALRIRLCAIFVCIMEFRSSR
jgi:hypothetical protein